MPFTFSTEEHMVMHFVYGCCSGKAIAAVE